MKQLIITLLIAVLALYSVSAQSRDDLQKIYDRCSQKFQNNDPCQKNRMLVPNRILDDEEKPEEKPLENTEEQGPAITDQMMPDDPANQQDGGEVTGDQGHTDESGEFNHTESETGEDDQSHTEENSNSDEKENENSATGEDGSGEVIYFEGNTGEQNKPEEGNGESGNSGEQDNGKEETQNNDEEEHGSTGEEEQEHTDEEDNGELDNGEVIYSDEVVYEHTTEEENNEEPDNGEQENGEQDNGEQDNGEQDNGEQDNGEQDNGEQEDDSNQQSGNQNQDFECRQNWYDTKDCTEEQLRNCEISDKDSLIDCISKCKSLIDVVQNGVDNMVECIREEFNYFTSAKILSISALLLGLYAFIF